MSEKTYWIREYEYREQIGHLVLITDIVESKENKHSVWVHEISINYNKDDFLHKTNLEWSPGINIKNDNSEEYKKKVIGFLDKHLQKINNRYDINLNNEVANTGKSVIKNLKATKVFNDLKKEMEKGILSKPLKALLNRFD